MEAQGRKVLAAALDIAQQTWPDRLVAAYALGSLAHGGFSAVSDIDVGLVLRDPLLATDGTHVSNLVDAVKGTRAPFADRLSVFWGSLSSLSGASEGGRFPPLDRLDLIKFGRLLAGSEVRAGLAVPSQRELVVVGAEFALSRLASEDVTQKLKDPLALLRSDPKTLTKLILYPVRFMFTARTGEVGRNEAAVKDFAAMADGPAARVARLALEWRNTPPTDEATAAQAIKAGVPPLYEEFLLDHERRLKDYARQDLAEAFCKWRHRLRAPL